MDLYIIQRIKGIAQVGKEYHNITKSHETAKIIVSNMLSNYDNFICTAQSEDEAKEICSKLNGF